MTRRHTPQEQFRQAVTIAKEHGLFVVEKAGIYSVFRKMVDRNVFIGRRSTPASLRTLVCKVTNFS